MSYLLQARTAKKTRQTQVIPGREKEMTRNEAGGVAFTADSWSRLERFLILGSEGGSYYVGESELTEQNVDNVRACIANDGRRAVQTIVEISESGRAPKNDPAIYALALASSYGADERVRSAALGWLPRVCRTGTHLFQYVAFVDTMRGWGPALRRAISDWYASKPTERLAYQLAKYQSRGGWSHKDVLALAHVGNMNTAPMRWVLGAKLGERSVLRVLTGENENPGHHPATGEKRTDTYGPAVGELPALIAGMDAAKRADVKTVVTLILNHGLTFEMIPTEHLKSADVWDALLQRMQPWAMIRSLGQMGSSGLLAPLSAASKLICSRLTDGEYLRNARVHPIQVLAALLTYAQGHGHRGSLTWTAVPQVTDALNDAFYATFNLVEPTGKSFFMGVDVSSSMMSGQVSGVAGLTPNMGAGAMAMLIARTEPNHFIGGFAKEFVDLKISNTDRLDAAMAKCQRDFGGTDCAVAIHYAEKHKIPVDCFVVITDGETWAGDQHACQALVQYRQKMGRDSKLVVITMTAHRTSLTDPADAGSLDVVGFDASVPTLINSFIGATTPKFEEAA